MKYENKKIWADSRKLAMVKR